LEQRIKDVLTLHPDYAGIVKFIVIPDFAVPGSCDYDAFKADEFDYIIHSAGEFRFDGTDIENDVVSPSLDA
jgi:hypothetical protein